MAVSAADLALGHFFRNPLQRISHHRQPHNWRLLWADVVELENADVLLSAVDAWELFECLVDESEVAGDLRTAIAEPGAPLTVAPDPGAPRCRTPPVAVRTHNLAPSHFCGESFDVRAEVSHLADGAGLGPYVVELEHDQLLDAAVRAGMLREVPADVHRRIALSPTLRPANLREMCIATSLEVRLKTLAAPPLTRVSVAVECGGGKRPPAAPAFPQRGFVRYPHRVRQRWLWWGRCRDRHIADPYAG